MNYVDAIIILVTLACGILGYWTGFVWQMTGVVSLLAGVAAVLILGPAVGGALARWLSPGVAGIAASLMLFATVSMTVRLLAAACGHYLKKYKLQSFDKAMGALLGAAKGLGICAVVVVILASHTERAGAVTHSLLGGPVVAATDWILGKARDAGITDAVHQSMDAARRQATEGLSRPDLAPPAPEDGADER